jgi:hypothetical protein
MEPVTVADRPVGADGAVSGALVAGRKGDATAGHPDAPNARPPLKLVKHCHDTVPAPRLAGSVPPGVAVTATEGARGARLVVPPPHADRQANTATRTNHRPRI